MICPRCNKENPEHKEMCLECGYPLKPIPIPCDGKIHFGSFDWYVLDKKEDRMLIVSEKVIGKMSYHNEETRITWETSNIREYLNGGFYNSFDVSDRNRIIEVINENKDNPWYGTNGGNSTNDKIFLLSIDEVVKYFGDSGQLKSKNKNTGCDWCKDEYFFFLSAQYNINRRSVDNSGTVVHWLLRSPGANNRLAALVYGMDLRDPFDHGDISISGEGGNMIDGHMVYDDSIYDDSIWLTVKYGIRPALWLKTT